MSDPPAGQYYWSSAAGRYVDPNTPTQPQASDHDGWPSDNWQDPSLAPADQQSAGWYGGYQGDSSNDTFFDPADQVRTDGSYGMRSDTQLFDWNLGVGSGGFQAPALQEPFNADWGGPTQTTGTGYLPPPSQQGMTMQDLPYGHYAAPVLSDEMALRLPYAQDSLAYEKTDTESAPADSGIYIEQKPVQCPSGADAATTGKNAKTAAHRANIDSLLSLMETATDEGYVDVSLRVGTIIAPTEANVKKLEELWRKVLEQKQSLGVQSASRSRRLVFHILMNERRDIKRERRAAAITFEKVVPDSAGNVPQSKKLNHFHRASATAAALEREATKRAMASVMSRSAEE